MTDDGRTMTILGSGLCLPDADWAQELGFSDAGLDPAVLPAMLRRRTSIATRIAVTAAGRACAAADSGRQLPAIFVSTLGEAQVTDQLCDAIARQDYPLSPTRFHNSVHNTAAGYWSMATGSTAAMQAMAGLEDGVALGLLEAWCQLQTVSERVLMVAYDEAAPSRLLPDYRWRACAFALVLGRDGDAADAGRPRLRRPMQGPRSDTTSPPAGFATHSPALALLPLMQALARPRAGRQRFSLSPGWHIDWLGT